MFPVSVFPYDELLVPAGCADDMRLFQPLSGGWLGLVAMAFGGRVGGGRLLDLNSW